MSASTPTARSAGQASPLAIKRGDIATFRRILDEIDFRAQLRRAEKGEAPLLHQHRQYHQLKRLYGSYIYHQDREKFDEELIEWIEKGRPTTLR